MHVARIARAAEEVILRDHPELEGNVSFHAECQHVAFDFIRVDLHVHVHDYRAYERIGRRFEDVLDHYRGAEEPYHFELEGVKFLIGDGDDNGAVSMVSSHHAAIWVRAWNYEQFEEDDDDLF